MLTERDLISLNRIKFVIFSTVTRILRGAIFCGNKTKPTLTDVYIKSRIFNKLKLASSEYYSTCRNYCGSCRL